MNIHGYADSAYETIFVYQATHGVVDAHGRVYSDEFSKTIASGAFLSRECHKTIEGVATTLRYDKYF